MGVIGRARKTDEQNAFNQALGRRIERFRRQRKISPASIARYLGMSYQRWYGYESGIATMPVYLLPKVARAIGVQAAALLPPAVCEPGPVVMGKGRRRAEKQLSSFDLFSENRCATEKKCG